MKSFFYLFAIVAFLATGCRKQQLNENQSIEKLSYDTQKALGSNSKLGLRQSYELLTNSEKMALWNAKWTSILENDANTLTSTQKDIIKSIQNFVNEITLEKLYREPKKGEDFITNNLPYFQKHFSNEQLYLLVECAYFTNNFTITQARQYVSQFSSNLLSISNLRGSDADGKNCECYYSIYCGLGAVCNDGGCTQVTGCGLLGTSNCTGICSNNLDPDPGHDTTKVPVDTSKHGTDTSGRKMRIYKL